MSTPCSQSLRTNRLVVSEYKVPKVLVSQECTLFFETPCRLQYSSISIQTNRISKTCILTVDIDKKFHQICIKVVPTILDSRHHGGFSPRKGWSCSCSYLGTTIFSGLTPSFQPFLTLFFPRSVLSLSISSLKSLCSSLQGSNMSQ